MKRICLIFVVLSLMGKMFVERFLSILIDNLIYFIEYYYELTLKWRNAKMMLHNVLLFFIHYSQWKNDVPTYKRFIIDIHNVQKMSHKRISCLMGFVTWKNCKKYLVLSIPYII